MWRREAKQIMHSFFYLMNIDTKNNLANGILGHTIDYIEIPQE